MQKQIFELKSSQPRSFGLLISLICLAIALYMALSKGHGYGLIACLGVFVFVIAMVKPSILKGPTRLWILIGIKLSKITNPLIMGLIYFLFLLPVSVILTLLRKDPLQLRQNKTITSYWHDINDDETNFSKF